jgi:hypothetical protein
MTSHNQSRLLGLLLTLISAFAVAVAKPDDYPQMKQWESFDFASQRISATDVAKVTPEDLKLIRGIVFGKHGRIFKDWEIKNYLKTRPWFKPNESFRNAMLNDTERHNLDVIRIAEAQHHETVQPGDMRLYQNQLLTRRKLGTHTNAEWTVLSAEIEAIHGKRFDDQPWLQQYFEERYWYEAKDNYKPSLSEIEKKNLKLIDTIRRQQRRVAIQPGDMELFEDKLITEAMLRGLSLHELRLLRNEIYARQGRFFQTLWLQQYFGSQMWYEPKEDFKDESITGTDKTNIETIVAYERKLHNQISTKPITRALLDGLFIEDVRKMRDEIQARRGKTFSNRWTQKYFESLDWYQPNPQYSEALLTPIEKRNLATIAAYEKRAVSALSVIEG